MNPGRVVLDRRKQVLVAKIAVQRSQLEGQIGAFRRPLQAFEIARGFGETLRRNAKLSGAVAACAGFMLMRGGLFSKALGTLQLASGATRWWLLARLGWQLVRRRRLRPEVLNGSGGRVISSSMAPGESTTR